MIGAFVPRPVDHPAGALSYGARLDLADRTLIHVGRAQGWSMRRIVSEIGVAASTVSREIARDSTAVGYKASTAQDRADLTGRAASGLSTSPIVAVCRFPVSTAALRGRSVSSP